LNAEDAIQNFLQVFSRVNRKIWSSKRNSQILPELLNFGQSSLVAQKANQMKLANSRYNGAVEMQKQLSYRLFR
jgi:hypothetical protein